MSGLPLELKEKIEKQFSRSGMKIEYAPGFDESLDRLFSMKPWYAIPRWFRDARHVVKMAWQRIVRGWDNDSVWNYSSSHAKETAQKMRYLAKHHNGCPDGLCHKDGYHFYDEKEDAPAGKAGTKCEWTEILEEIAQGFEAQLRLAENSYMLDTDDKEVWKQRALALEIVADRGWELYRRHYRSLWD